MVRARSLPAASRWSAKLLGGVPATATKVKTIRASLLVTNIHGPPSLPKKTVADSRPLRAGGRESLLLACGSQAPPKRNAGGARRGRAGKWTEPGAALPARSVAGVRFSGARAGTAVAPGLRR